MAALPLSSKWTTGVRVMPTHLAVANLTSTLLSLEWTTLQPQHLTFASLKTAPFATTRAVRLAATGLGKMEMIAATQCQLTKV